MARDRLAAMRAAQQQGGGYQQQPAPPSLPTHQQQQDGYGGGYSGAQGGGGGQGGGYGGQGQPGYRPQPNYDQGRGAGRGGYGAVPTENKEEYGGESYEMQNGVGKGGPQDLNSFMNEMSDLNDGLKSVSTNVDKIRDLHARALSQLDESQHAQITAQLQALTSETSRMTNSIKNRINTLHQQNAKLPPGDDANVRRQQVGALKTRFMDVIQKYQNVERDSRQKYRARMERQYKIVKPDATDDEVRAAVENDDQGQVFSNALLNSNRYGDARAAYREVQERHEDIRKIEKTITELMQMFNDLANIVERDDQMITNIEGNATNVNQDTENAGQQMTKAKKSAWAARRKRWICFWIIVLIIIAVAIIIALVVLHDQGKL